MVSCMGQPWGAGGEDHPAAVWVLQYEDRCSIPERAGVSDGDKRAERMVGMATAGVDFGEGA